MSKFAIQSPKFAKFNPKYYCKKQLYTPNSLLQPIFHGCRLFSLNVMFGLHKWRLKSKLIRRNFLCKIKAGHDITSYPALFSSDVAALYSASIIIILFVLASAILTKHSLLLSFSFFISSAPFGFTFLQYHNTP